MIAMKIKLPLTEKFLLDVYDFIIELDESFDAISPKPMSHVLYRQFYRLRRNYEKEMGRKKFQQLLAHLKRRGWIKVPIAKNKEGIVLTSRGAERILQIRKKAGKLPKRSDGKWQMVMYDIPEEKYDERVFFRQDLKKIGYAMLQKSIWVCPYDVLEPTKRLIEQYGLQEYVKLLLVEEIEI